MFNMPVYVKWVKMTKSEICVQLQVTPFYMDIEFGVPGTAQVAQAYSHLGLVRFKGTKLNHVLKGWNFKRINMSKHTCVVWPLNQASFQGPCLWLSSSYVFFLFDWFKSQDPWPGLGGQDHSIPNWTLSSAVSLFLFSWCCGQGWICHF